MGNKIEKEKMKNKKRRVKPIGFARGSPRPNPLLTKLGSALVVGGITPVLGVVHVSIVGRIAPLLGLVHAAAVR